MEADTCESPEVAAQLLRSDVVSLFPHTQLCAAHNHLYEH